MRFTACSRDTSLSSEITRLTVWNLASSFSSSTAIFQLSVRSSLCSAPASQVRTATLGNDRVPGSILNFIFRPRTKHDCCRNLVYPGYRSEVRSSQIVPKDNNSKPRKFSRHAPTPLGRKSSNFHL